MLVPRLRTEGCALARAPQNANPRTHTARGGYRNDPSDFFSVCSTAQRAHGVSRGLSNLRQRAFPSEGGRWALTILSGKPATRSLVKLPVGATIPSGVVSVQSAG